MLQVSSAAMVCSDRNIRQAANRIRRKEISTLNDGKTHMHLSLREECDIPKTTFQKLMTHRLAIDRHGLRSLPCAGPIWNTRMTPASLKMTNSSLRKTVSLVALLNLAYFAVEFAVALAIGSVSLFADSVDFFEDAAVNFLIFIALAWTATNRARVGMALAGILLLPVLAFIWALWSKLNSPVPPESLSLGVTGLGALVINLTCAFMLARYKHHAGSLTKAAFLSARNDALANIAIIGAGIITALHASVWPDVIVGLGIAYMNADAAKEVWQAARAEQHVNSVNA